MDVSGKGKPIVPPLNLDALKPKQDGGIGSPGTGSKLDSLATRTPVTDSSVDKHVKQTGKSVRLSDIPVQQGNGDKKPAISSDKHTDVKNFLKSIGHFFTSTLPESIFLIKMKVQESQYDRWDAKPSKLPPSDKDFLDRALDYRKDGGREQFHTFITQEIKAAKKTADENLLAGKFPVIWQEVLNDKMRTEVHNCKSYDKMFSRLESAYVQLNFYEGSNRKDMLQLRDLVGVMLGKYDGPEKVTKHVKSELDARLTDYLKTELEKETPFRQATDEMRLQGAVMMMGNDKFLNDIRDDVKGRLPASVPPQFKDMSISSVTSDPAFKKMAFDIVKDIIGKHFDGTTDKGAMNVAVKLGVTAREHVADGLKEIAKVHAGLDDPGNSVSVSQGHFKNSAFVLRMLSPLFASDLANDFQVSIKGGRGDEAISPMSFKRELLVECSKLIQRAVGSGTPESAFAITGLSASQKDAYVQFATNLRLSVENIAGKC